MEKFLKLMIGSLLFLCLSGSLFFYMLNKDKDQKNGFTRTFLTTGAQLINTIPIDSKHYYFAQAHPDHPVIHQLFDPTKIVRVSPNLNLIAIL